jgi:hypothetical protein
MGCQMNHDELVYYAARWLGKDHPLVITEMVHGGGESPDAIGFKTHVSTIVECKTTRADFFSDAKKYFRRDPERGMGDHRYYLTPKGLLDVEEIPNRWGLLEVKGNRVYKIKRSTIQKEKNFRSEQSLLVSCVRRLGKDVDKGVNVKVYDMITNNHPKATIGII